MVVVTLMRHGWVYIYESPPAESRFEELVEILAQNGISLARPGSGEIVRLSPHGETIASSKQDILRELAQSNKVPMLLYLDASTSVFCSIDKLGPDIVRESYSLDGTTEQESLRVIRSLIQLFSYGAKRATAFAVVVDKYAELHRDFHWDDFILGTSEPPEWPMFLGFSKSFQRLTNVPSSYVLTDRGSHLLLSSRNSGFEDLATPAQPK